VRHTDDQRLVQYIHGKHGFGQVAQLGAIDIQVAMAEAAPGQDRCPLAQAVNGAHDGPPLLDIGAAGQRFRYRPVADDQRPAGQPQPQTGPAQRFKLALRRFGLDGRGYTGRAVQNSFSASLDCTQFKVPGAMAARQLELL